MYQSKPQLAVVLIDELCQYGFRFELVLADSLYGESGDFIQALSDRGLHYVVAMRENHGAWLLRGQRVRANRWHTFDRLFRHGETKRRYIREAIFGRRGPVRYYQITTDQEKLPPESTWFVMTHLPG
nr:transposase [Nitrosococcus watsonii]